MKLPEYWIHFPAIAHSSSLLSNLLLHLMGKEEHPPLLLPLLHCHLVPCSRHSRIINEWLLYTWTGGHAQIPSCQMLQHNIYLHKHNKGASVLASFASQGNGQQSYVGMTQFASFQGLNGSESLQEIHRIKGLIFRWWDDMSCITTVLPFASFPVLPCLKLRSMTCPTVLLLNPHPAHWFIIIILAEARTGILGRGNSKGVL